MLPLRSWPLKNYLELTKKLLVELDLFIVLVGNKIQSLFDNDNLHTMISPRVLNLMGKTTIEELIDLCNISDLLISHDCGITNLASLTNINLIVLFGPETPVLYSPLSDKKTVLYVGLSCSPCLSAFNHRRSICKDNKCMQSISVEEVYRYAMGYLFKLEKQCSIS
jgi:ADP-heptose:LPS heptosyltransferase